MGIPSLNSAILYNVSLYFHYKDPSLPLRMTPKSCKYNKYPELPSTKTALFMDDTPIFPFPSTKTAIFMDRKRQPKAVLSGRRELNYVIKYHSLCLKHRQ